MTVWQDVEEGDVLKGRDGYAWTVIAVDPTPSGEAEFTLERHGREPFKVTPLPMTEVERLERGQRSESVATAIAGLVLGAEVVAHQREPDGPWYVQATGWTLPDLLTHLDVFHNYRPTTSMTTAEAEKHHLKLHDLGEVANPHIHDDSPFRREGKVSWG